LQEAKRHKHELFGAYGGVAQAPLWAMD
jgi:hypothetical protein